MLTITHQVCWSCIAKSYSYSRPFNGGPRLFETPQVVLFSTTEKLFGMYPRRQLQPYCAIYTLGVIEYGNSMKFITINSSLYITIIFRIWDCQGQAALEENYNRGLQDAHCWSCCVTCCFANFPLLELCSSKCSNCSLGLGEIWATWGETDWTFQWAARRTARMLREVVHELVHYSIAILKTIVCGISMIEAPVVVDCNHYNYTNYSQFHSVNSE